MPKRKSQVRLITAGRSPLRVLLVRLALLVMLVGPMMFFQYYQGKEAEAGK